MSYKWYLGNSTTTCVQATCSSTVTVWIGFMIKTWAKLPSILTVGFLPASERSIRPMSPSTMAKQTDSLVNLEILLTLTMDNAELSYLLEVRGLRNEVKIYLIAGCRFPEEKSIQLSILDCMLIRNSTSKIPWGGNFECLKKF